MAPRRSAGRWNVLPDAGRLSAGDGETELSVWHYCRKLWMRSAKAADHTFSHCVSDGGLKLRPSQLADHFSRLII